MSELLAPSEMLDIRNALIDAARHATEFAYNHCSRIRRVLTKHRTGLTSLEIADLTGLDYPRRRAPDKRPERRQGSCELRRAAGQPERADGDGVEGEVTDMPTSVWSGSFVIFGIEIKCHVLDDGQRIIEADSIEALFSSPTETTAGGDLEEFTNWIHFGRPQ